MRMKQLLNFVYTSVLRCSSTRLINFPQTWGEQRTPSASSSLCVSTKNQQILIFGEWYANCSQMAQCRFAVPSIHTCIWFANHSAHSCIRGFRKKILLCAELLPTIALQLRLQFSLTATMVNQVCVSEECHAAPVSIILCTTVHSPTTPSGPNYFCCTFRYALIFRPGTLYCNFRDVSHQKIL